MRRPKPTRRFPAKHSRHREEEEIELIGSWIEAAKPAPGTKPPPLPAKTATAAAAAAKKKKKRSAVGGGGGVGRFADGGYSDYAARELFVELPISRKMRDGLAQAGYVAMSEIQRAALPHALCGRDVLGAAKTGSGKTLAFLIPVIEKLYRTRWGPEDGVGCIILSPTKDLAGQLFDVLRKVGKYHSLSAGLLVGGRKGVDDEKERVNGLNILVCTPGRLLQHMDETPNFDCSQLQVLVLDEADRILDQGFKKEVNAILSQLPKIRQTLLFSATQTKSVKDLARVSLKDPEYISVHEESATATPENLQQFAMIVPLEQKLNMLWSFIKRHLKSKILVFLSSVKQVKFVYETFKKLRPGIPLKCMHGRMKYIVQQAIVAEFNETISVLFSTDIFARGLDIQNVDWVVQVDCPEDVPLYIHRVGRTARYNKKGKALIFLCPEEEKMLEKLQSLESKIPIQTRKPKAEQLEQISGRLASVLVQYPNMQQLGKRAFVTYLKSVHLHKDKEVFDLSRFPPEKLAAFASSLGLPVTPKIRFISQNKKAQKEPVEEADMEESKADSKAEIGEMSTQYNKKVLSNEELEDDILRPKMSSINIEPEKVKELGTRVLKNKKLKINIHRPSGTRLKYDEDGNVIPPLASIADAVDSEAVVHTDKVKERYAKLREELKKQDKEDKVFHREIRREKRKEKKTKLKRRRVEEEEAGSDVSESDKAEIVVSKRTKIYFNSDDEGDEKAVNGVGLDASDREIVAQQEALALKLLGSMHS